jgi:L-aspartate oxidase
VVREHPLIEILEHTEVTRLLMHRDRMAGVVALPHGGESYVLPTPAVVLATGGVGQLYAVTTNPRVATADGWALAHRIGARLRDLEFLQFHPTALKLPGVNPAPLISEAVRGAGAILVDKDGRRFALEADERGELAPRDVLARAVAAADTSGGAWLDARAVADVPALFPGITAMLAHHGLDPSRDLLPVAPALHYAMGGIQTDLEGRASIPGLWAVGEVASTGVHGANRLASNSLLEGLVFADRAGLSVGAAAATHAAHDSRLTTAAPERDSGADEAHEQTRRAMRELMTANVGVQRTETSLLRAEQELDRLTRATEAAAWRTRNQLLVARLITEAARRRRESRGGHRRLDYPPGAPQREAV